MTSNRLWYGILTGVMVIWSSNYVFFRFLLNDLSPETVLIYRYLFASLTLAGILFILPSTKPQPLTRRQWLSLIVASLCGTLIGGGGVLYGITLSGASLASILINTSPLFITLIALALGMERLSHVRIGGIGLGIIGVGLVVWGSSTSAEIVGTNLVGVGLLLIASFGLAVYTIIGKRLIHRLGGLRYTLYGILPALALIMMYYGLTNISVFRIATYWQWFGLVYVGALGTAVTWCLFSISLKHIDVSTAASFKLAIPVFTAINAYLAFGETLTTTTIIGMFGVLLGIFIAINHTNIQKIYGRV